MAARTLPLPEVLTRMRLVTVLSVLLGFVFPGSAAFAAPDLIKTLPNKVTLVVREVHTRPIVSIQAWVRAGARDESAKDRGLSAGVAQCIMEATDGHPELGAMKRELYAVAGRYESEAAYDFSYFDVTLPARSFAKGVDLLAEGLIRARLDAPVVDAALGRVKGRSRTILGDADRAAVNAARAELHQGNPLVSPLAVPEVEYTAITHTLVQRFHRDYYVAENLTLVVTGDVDAAEVAEKVESAFAKMRRGKGASRPRFSERPFEGPRAVAVRTPHETGGTAITIGFRTPAWGSADAIALDAMMAVLVDSPISRTQRKLNAGNAEFIRASSIRHFETDGGTVTLSFAVNPDSLDEAEGALLTLVEQARSTPVTTEEFEAAVSTVLQRDLTARADQSGVGKATALAVLRGAPGSDEVYAARVRALKPEDLIAAARKYLDIKKSVVIEMAADSVLQHRRSDLTRRIRDKQAVYEAAYRTGPAVTASQDAERAARIDAPLRSIAAGPLDAGRGRVNRSVLPGGARLLVGEDHSAPLVTVAIYLLGGVRYESDKTNGVTALLRESLLNTNDPKARGLTYRQALSRMGQMVSYQDKDMWGCSVTLPADSWRETLQKIGTMFAHPDLDTVNVDATRIYVLDALDRWLHDDDAQRQRLIFPTKYAVSGYRLPALGSHRTLVSMPHAQVVEWYEKFVVKENMVVSVFGDVAAGEVASVAGEAIRDVSAKPFRPGPVPEEMSFDGFREKWELGEGPSTTVTLAFDGPPARSPDIPACYVFASVLSGPKGWFEEHIMSTGGVKGANAILSHALDESPVIATITVGGGPLQESDMVKLLFRQFKKAALLPLRGDLAPVLENARVHASGGYLMTLDSNPTRGLQFARAELFGLGIDYPILLAAKIDAVTPEDLLRIGLRYFQRSEWVRAGYAIAETRPGGW